MQDVTNSEDTIPKLFKAIESGRVDEVRELLETDPKLASARNKDGASALTWATYYRHKGISDLMLATGLKADIFEASPLRLNAGADVGAKTEEGKMPMDFAVDGDHSEMVALLERATGSGT